MGKIKDARREGPAKTGRVQGAGAGRSHAPPCAGRIRPGNAAATRTGRPLATVLPRGLSLHKITEELLKNAAERLNKRPRNWLTDQTLAEVFNLARTAAPASCMHRMGGT